MLPPLAISDVMPDVFPLLTRLGIDVLGMLLLVGWLYRRRLAAPEMALVFTALNMGLFAAIASIGTGSFPTGVGFGLFGLLSLVRLRSAAFTLKDVAYTFVALVIGLVTALPERSVLIAVILDVLLLATLWFVDDTRWRTPVTRVIRITLDHAVTGSTEASLAVSRRLDVEPLDVVIEDVDLVRDTTRVAVRVAAPPGSWRPASTDPGRPSMLSDLLRVDRTPVSLETVLAQAPALTRIDRKYLVPVPVARQFVASLPEEWRALEFGDRTSSQYHSRYFDTRCWQAAREHVQRRRRRWKVRRRTYLEDGLCRLEVKTKDGRGHTVKALLESPHSSEEDLSTAEREFVAGVFGGHAVALDPGALAPSMEISYERLTMARTGATPARLTIDWKVDCVTAHGRVWVDHDHVLVETKGDLRPTDADRLLVGLGHRPRWFSKYTAAACLLAPGLPDNDVRSLCGRHLHTDRSPVSKGHVA